MIIHTDQEEPLRRRGRPGLRARPPLQQRRHFVDPPPPATDLDERAGNRGFAWGRFTVHHRVPVLVVGVVLLGAVALPAALLLGVC